MQHERFLCPSEEQIEEDINLEFEKWRGDRGDSGVHINEKENNVSLVNCTVDQKFGVSEYDFADNYKTIGNGEVDGDNKMEIEITSDILGSINRIDVPQTEVKASRPRRLCNVPQGHNKKRQRKSARF